MKLNQDEKKAIDEDVRDAWQLHVEENLTSVCHPCNGSGQGYAEFSSCGTCCGRGQLIAIDEDDFENFEFEYMEKLEEKHLKKLMSQV